jgi:myo-inositol-1(or 4)-monophosphatase
MTEATQNAISARYDHACLIARQAGQRALGHFNARDTLVIEAKANPQDVVSRADREVEDVLRAAILSQFPDDSILGEEGKPTNGTSGFVWVIDPIDGTMPFLSGIPQWCVAIALLHDNETVAAATFVPATDILFRARKGGGMFSNELRCTIPSNLGLTNAMTAIGASHRVAPDVIAATIRALVEKGGAFYRNGSGALMLAQVACGQMAGYVEHHMNAWDCLGGLLMITEAGGRIVEPDMAQMLQQGGPVLGAAPLAYAALHEIAGFGVVGA